MYKIEPNYKDSVFKITLSGAISLETVEEMTKELYSITPLETYLLLTDVRGSTYDFHIEDFSFLVEMSKKYAKPDTKFYEAILIDSPKEVAISTLFKMENKKENHKVKIFSTEVAALNWLMGFKNK